MQNYKRFMKVVGGGVLAINFFLFLWFLSTENLVKTAQQHMKALLQKDIVAAYQLTSQAFRKKVSLSRFKKFVRKYSVLEKRGDFFISERSFKGRQGNVSGTFHDVQNIWWRVHFQMIYEQDKWKIQALRLRREVPGKAGTWASVFFDPAAPVVLH